MIVDVNNLKKRYKKEWVLKGIDITLDQPNIVALVGPNGSGKTTLLNCMTNLLSFQEGEIELLEKKHTDTSLFYDMSYLQDNRILYGNLTGYDHLKFICQVQKIPLAKMTTVAEKVKMVSYLKKRVRNYSLGMKQHLLLAMAIMNDPKLLLLDEPLNGLDPTSAINMREILVELHQGGTSIIVSSHNLDEIDRLTNTIYFMKDGSLLKESLQDFSVNQYQVSVSDLEKAKTVLTDNAVPFTVSGDDNISFEESDVELQTVIEYLNQNDMTIVDIEKQKVGAEKRYRQLFEGVDTHEDAPL